MPAVARRMATERPPKPLPITAARRSSRRSTIALREARDLAAEGVERLRRGHRRGEPLPRRAQAPVRPGPAALSDRGRQGLAHPIEHGARRRAGSGLRFVEERQELADAGRAVLGEPGPGQVGRRRRRSSWPLWRRAAPRPPRSSSICRATPSSPPKPPSAATTGGAAPAASAPATAESSIRLAVLSWVVIATTEASWSAGTEPTPSARSSA